MFGRGVAWLRGHWASGAVTPLVCRETAFELLDVLSYRKFKLGHRLINRIQIRADASFTRAI
jgi:hypothetical protein